VSTAATQPGPRCAGLVLAPGASAGRDQPSLVAIDEAVSEKGIVVERMDFGYRSAGRRAPDRAPVLIAEVVDHARELSLRTGARQNRVALGGRSMGGRIASMAVAEGLPAAALVLVSYPLHPPGHPEKSRVEHLGSITVPCMFVSGTRDAFGTPDELESATAAITGPVTHVWLEGGDHGLRRRDAEVASIVASWLRGPSKRKKT
jgi:predicted alpha/beta-hydrolase family hydrolase